MKNLLIITTIEATLRAFFIPLARHFQAQGWRVDAIAKDATHSPDCLANFDQVWESDWSRNPLKLENLWIAPKQLLQVLQQKHYDLVLVSTPVAAFVTRCTIATLKPPKPKVIYTAQGFHFYQGGSALRNATFLALEKIAGRWTDYLVVVNHEDQEAAIHHRLVECDRVRHIPGTGVNLDRYNATTVSAEETEQIRQELGLARETQLITAIAEFIPRKHHSDLLRAFARIDRPHVHLALAGDGPLLASMKQLARDLGVQSRVHFLGRRRDVPVLLSASIASILVSEQEGLPNCVMESLSMGVPVIGTDIRGTRDLLQNGAGLLVAVGDVEQLTTAIVWVLNHPAEARAMAQRGQQRLSTYGVQPILQQYQALTVEAVGSV